MKRGISKARARVQFVFGLKNALPARRELIEFLVKGRDDAPRVDLDGRRNGQESAGREPLGAGARRPRADGLEDNLRFDEHRLAASNAELVARVAALTKEYGRTVASPAEARALLGLETA